MPLQHRPLRAFGAAVLAAGLLAAAGCAGMSSVPSATSLSQAAASRVSVPALPAVVFVADLKTGAVWELPAANFRGRPIAKLTRGVNRPDGLAVDSSGNVFVANEFGNDITVYAPGQSAPMRAIGARVHHPVAVALGSDGTVAIGNDFGIQHATSVVVFDKGSATPTRIIDVPLEGQLLVGIRGLAIDKNGNLFVSVNRYPKETETMLEFAPGSTKGVQTGIPPGTINGMDAAGNLYDGFTTQVNVYAPGRSTPSRVIKRGVQSAALPAVLPDGTLYLPNTASQVFGRGNVVQYAPGGSSPVATNATGADVYPLAAAFRPAM